MDNYEDIINLIRPASKHTPMSLHSRAAQFAPFSALSGLDDQVDETARLVDKRHELTDDEKNLLDINMQYIIENIYSRPFVQILYFVEDNAKQGGAYYKTSGKIRRISETEGIVIFEDKKQIPINDIMAIKIQIIKSPN